MYITETTSPATSSSGNLGKHIIVYDFDFQDTSIHVIVIVRN